MDFMPCFSLNGFSFNLIVFIDSLSSSSVKWFPSCRPLHNHNFIHQMHNYLLKRSTVVAVIFFYRPKRIPLFVVEIIMDLNGVRYNTPLNNFEASLVFHYNKAIQLCQHIPCIEKVSTNLYAHISATDYCVIRIRLSFFILISVLYRSQST